MAAIHNPFIVGGYISPHYFCDREKVDTQHYERKKCRYHFYTPYGKDRLDSPLLLSKRNKGTLPYILH